MPETAKFATESAKQGYPAATNDTDILKADRELLMSLYADKAKRTNPDSVKELELGKLCDALRDPVKYKVVDMCSKTSGGVYKLFEEHAKWKTKPPRREDVNVNVKEIKMGDMTFMMGPLKKVPRIMQKAVGYAVKEDAPEIRLDRVVDVLRGTLIFENEEFLLFNPDNQTPNIGSRLIDAIHKDFGNGVIQVKNRFMLKRQPKINHATDKDFLAALDKLGRNAPPKLDVSGYEIEDPDLVNTIATVVNLELNGRDTFYRDLQLLIKLPTANYSNDVVSPLTHTYFELQITTRSLIDAKSGSPTKDTGHPDSPNGHKRYEQLRRVMEYCEYLYWTYQRTEDKKANFNKYKLSKDLLTEFYSTPLWADFDAFDDSLKQMWKLYQDYAPSGRKMEGIRNAIDHSDWYKNAK